MDGDWTKSRAPVEVAVRNELAAAELAKLAVWAELQRAANPAATRPCFRRVSWSGRWSRGRRAPALAWTERLRGRMGAALRPPLRRISRWAGAVRRRPREQQARFARPASPLSADSIRELRAPALRNRPAAPSAPGLNASKVKAHLLRAPSIQRQREGIRHEFGEELDSDDRRSCFGRQANSCGSGGGGGRGAPTQDLLD